MSWRETAKKRAALESVKHIKDGFVLGLGTGSTVAFALKEIGRRVKEENLQVSGVPTSHRTSLLAAEYGIPITTLNEHLQLDLDIDGADQIDKELNLIKGMGGAFTREKIVAAASKEIIIVADETKLTYNLGKGQSLPIEILPFGLPLTIKRIKLIGGKPVLREKEDRFGPYVTDNGNFIVDVDFGKISLTDNFEKKLKSIPGVIETGLFIRMANLAYVGTETSVKTIRR